MKSTNPLRIVACLVPLLSSFPSAQATILDLGGAIGDRFGQDCCVVGDADGDGFGDVVVSAMNAGIAGAIQAGRVDLYSGLTGAPLATTYGNMHVDRLGWAASAVGDVNGDGRGDYCATSVGTSDPGEARVLSGLDGSVLHSFTGPANDLFGWAMAGVGDVNGDGRDDVLVAAPNDALPGGLMVGSLVVFSGADGSVLHRVFGDEPSGLLGQSVGRVGDVDGDGK